jgi:hypothetical protein
MNTRAECRNQKCSQNGVEKSVMVGQFQGYGAGDDHVLCPECGLKVTTTETIDYTATVLYGYTTLRLEGQIRKVYAPNTAPQAISERIAPATKPSQWTRLGIGASPSSVMPANDTAI